MEGLGGIVLAWRDRITEVSRSEAHEKMDRNKKLGYQCELITRYATCNARVFSTAKPETQGLRVYTMRMSNEY